jgi:N utilization substance protein B
MLTRRHLRIKVLQALYAFFQSENDRVDVAERQMLQSLEKIYDLCIYHLSFLIELNEFAAQRLEDGKLKHRPTAEDLNPNLRFVKNSLIYQIKRNRDFQQRADSLKIHWNDQENLVRKIYNQLKESTMYQQYMAAPVVGFKQDKELVVHLFNELVVNNNVVQFIYEEKNIFWTNDQHTENLKITRTSFTEEDTINYADREIVQKLYKRYADEDGNLEILCEEDSIYPENDYYFAAYIVNKILREWHNNSDEYTPLPPLLRSLPGDDNDKEFMQLLFRKTIVDKGIFNEVIAKHAQNWELDRIATMDILIIQMALTELTQFPSIPVKVSMNEYIDLAKIFSTPKSSQFINGLLDKMVAELKEDKTIVKTGRGLME